MSTIQNIASETWQYIVQFFNYLIEIWRKVPVSYQVAFTNIIKIGGIILGFKPSVSFLTEFESGAVNLVGFTFLVGIAFLTIGVVLSYILILTGNFK